jgi:hypothetical protein
MALNDYNERFDRITRLRNFLTDYEGRFDDVSRIGTNISNYERFIPYIANLLREEENKLEREPGDIVNNSYLVAQKPIFGVGRLIPGLENLNYDLKGFTLFTWGDSDDNVLFVDETTWNVNKPKIITRTELRGLEGTIKEYFSTSDWNISCNLLIGTEVPDLVPEKQIVKAIEMCNFEGSITIVNDFMNNRMGIDNMIIERFNITETNVLNIQNIQISGFSDKSFERTRRFTTE